MRENTDQNNSKYGHFWRTVFKSNFRLQINQFLELQFKWLVSVWVDPEVVTQRCSVKKVFWKISQNSQKHQKRSSVVTGIKLYYWLQVEVSLLQ